LRRTLITTLKVGMYGSLIGLVALIVAVGVAMGSLPSYQELVKRDDLGQMIRVRAADGSVLVALGPSFGEWLSYDQIPDIMKDAMVAVEDKRFRSHIGVDPIGLARAARVRVSKGRWTQGGSTITQQLARNIFLTNSRTFGRKGREGVLALALERRFSKDQILELYLNRVYFGGGAYGIDAASRRFFGHSAKTLSLSEAAIIAGLVKAPSNYAPTADPEAARGRAAVVIKIMQENGDITPAMAVGAEPAEVQMVPTPRQNSVRYFTDWVLPQLDTLIDETVAPIEVWTTLDPNMQRLGDQVINATTPEGAQGALVALDRDGSIRAMIGGRDYVRSLYNRATQATRQPGSAFKLFVYLAAIEAGYKPEVMVSDEPLKINGWSPRNNNRGFAGQVTVRQAFAQSINTVSVRLAQEVGFRTVADMAQRFGITTPVVTHPSMALGSCSCRAPSTDG
jgi:penicillin-binding protein 1A